MKRVYLPALLFIIACVHNCYAQVPGYVPTTGLLAYYGFNSNCNDLSGNGAHGTMIGASYAADRYGTGASAVYFTGSGERINTSRIDRTAVNNFSYSVWVNPQASMTMPALGSTGGLTSSSSYTCVIAPVNGWNWATSGTDVAAGLNVATNGLYICEHGPSITNVALVWSGSLSGWHHIAVVYTSKQPKLYVDGAFVATGLVSTYNVHPSMGCDSFFVGGPVPYPYITAGFGHGLYPIAVPTYNYTGSIDDIAIYGRSLTSCEVTRLYDTVTTTTPTISGPSTLCSGASATLTSSSGGGTWDASLYGGTVLIGATSGVMTGLSAGMAIITYAYASGCMATKSVTVDGVPPILGMTTLCLGGPSSTLSNSAPGGVWISSDTSVATINSTTGALSPVALGTATVTYQLSPTCYNATTVWVVDSVPAITGSFFLCPGAVTTFTDSITGGIWSSTNPSVATIGSATGVVTAISPGVDTIYYTIGGGCTESVVVTVSTAPPAITGTRSICAGQTSTLGNAATGGTWSSSNPTVASIGSASGIVLGGPAGIVTITYTVSSGCYITAPVTVLVTPVGITGGSATICTGLTSTMSCGPSGGVWATSSTGIATVGSTGIVTAVSAGTASISYTTSGVCTVTRAITVNTSPAAIAGPSLVCVGSTITLSNSTTGGTWSSSNVAAAPIGSVSGIVTGNAVSVPNMTYTLSNACRAVKQVTVSATPTSFSGARTVCEGANILLNNSIGGGVWSTVSSAIAVVGSTTGYVTGVTVGVTSISYTLATGCASAVSVTVIASPAAITGASSLCVGTTSLLFNTVGGGAWSSSNPAVASVGSSSGMVYGAAAGVADISYTLLSTGCAVTRQVTVVAAPSAITGLLNTCVSGSTALSATPGGGSWSSGATGVAGVGSASGIITGISTGSATITYSIGPGCTSTATLTVVAAPAAISGPTSVCIGRSITLSDAVAGGVWASSATTVGTIGSATGIVASVTPGVTTISYSTSAATGCAAVVNLTVNPLPAAITGSASICAGNTSLLVSTTSGGAWTSVTTPVATVGSASGLVSAIAAGTSVISYSLPTGCFTTTTVTVNPLPSPISGGTYLCIGGTATLTSSGGGFWSSSDITLADVDVSSGLVTGITSGTVTISYTISSGCYTTRTITVSSAPPPITGAPNVCISATTVLADAGVGGTWTSSSTGIATIGSASGMVAGVATGVCTITYSMGAGCYTTRLMTVSPLPTMIIGPSSVCVGLSGTLVNGSAGGTWSTSNTNATIGSSSGIITGVLAGITVVTYTLPTGCYATKSFTVNTSPAAITGSPLACIGLTTTLSNPYAGGTWTSGATGVATIGSSGTVTGVAAGTATITYSLGAGCSATVVVTVNPLPGAIVGPASVCAGATVLLTNATTGGRWYSGGTSVASIGSLSGLVTGVVAGATTITYTAPTGCSRTTPITVNPLPSPIAGPSAVCVGATITATSSGTGTWSSASAGIATVGSGTGIVTGVVTGATAISYTLPTGCVVTKIITVSPAPSAIGGMPTVCVGATTTLTNSVAGGVWSSSSASAGIGSSSGSVSGMAAGTTTITYSLGASCTVTRAMTVVPSPAPISGSSSVCAGTTTTFTDATTGGAWSTGSTGVATVGVTSGLVSGVGVGIATITYTMGVTGCMATKVITVNTVPAPISGPATVCVGSVAIETNIISGGFWTASSSVVSIGSSSGVVTGVVAGTVTISYSIGTCTVTRAMSVNGVSPITGAGTLCELSTLAYADATPGGRWSSSNPGIVAIGSATGMATGTGAGVATLTYSIGLTGCVATKTVTVNSAPAPITGPASVCTGASVTETNTVSGGVWSTGSPLITLGSLSGIVTGVGGGTAMITYSIESCYVTRLLTVNFIAPVLGADGICVGGVTAYTDATSGGSWSSSSSGVATVSATGLVSAVGTGTATISYSILSGCIATKTITVNSGPTSISGTASVCAGSTSTLSNGAPGGVWSSGTMAVATIGSGTGIVNALGAGVTTITYSLGPGCTTTKVVTVMPVPLPIIGPSLVCIGAVATLSSATTGGRWTSGSPAVAGVGSSTGFAIGASAGVTVITYTLPTGCIVTRNLTVNTSPSPITGIAGVCIGSTTTLSDAIAGGIWSSASSSIASVGTSGIVTGVAAGAITITYSMGTGCAATRLVTVYPLPLAISGTATLCIGNIAVLTDATPGGTWSSAGTGVATIGSGTGVVTGVTVGTATITYTSAAGCHVTRVVTVNPPPSVITGISAVCVGSSITLANATPGGAWSSSNPIVAAVGSGSGIVSGMATGSATISYTTGMGCAAIKMVTVDPPPASITGGHIVCAGATMALGNPVSGGTWNSGAPGIAAVSSTGVVTGVAGGVVSISYTITTGCTATHTVTVNAVPPITGRSAICAWGDTVIVRNTDPGGSYSSTLVTVSSLGGGNGLVTGFAPGTATVTYTLYATGCATTRLITVNPLPANITGSMSVCVGRTTVLSNAAGGGTWSSGSPGIAAVGPSTGVVTGLVAGTAVLTYTLPTGCMTDTPVVVSPSPAAITGWGSVVIIGTSTTYACATPGGTWSSSSSTIATVGSASGLVSGRAAGVVTITYTLATGCYATRTLTVTPLASLRPGYSIGDARNVEVFPNPGNGVFYVKGVMPVEPTQEIHEIMIEIMNVQGQKVYSKKVLSADGSIDDEVLLDNALPDGVYFFMIHSAGGREVFPIVVQR